MCTRKSWSKRILGNWELCIWFLREKIACIGPEGPGYTSRYLYAPKNPGPQSFRSSGKNSRGMSPLSGGLIAKKSMITYKGLKRF